MRNQFNKYFDKIIQFAMKDFVDIQAAKMFACYYSPERFFIYAAQKFNEEGTSECAFPDYYEDIHGHYSGEIAIQLFISLTMDGIGEGGVHDICGRRSFANPVFNPWTGIASTAICARGGSRKYSRRSSTEAC